MICKYKRHKHINRKQWMDVDGTDGLLSPPYMEAEGSGPFKKVKITLTV